MSTKRSNQLSYNPMSDECIIHDMRETCKMLFTISCIWRVTDAASTLQLAILLWIAVSAIDAADPICFIYRIRSSPCRKMTGASFPAGRAYGGQDTDLLQIHLSGLPKANKRSRLLLCTHPQVFGTWGYLRNQNSLYKRIPRLAGSCKSGVFVSL